MTEIQKALVGALADLDDPTKNRKGAHGATYVDLAGLLSHIRPILAKHDLAVTQDVVVDDGTLIVTTEILHSGGEARVYGPAKVRAAGDMQSLGGFITYLRRYQLSAALGIAGAEDDDGHSVKGRDVAPALVDVGRATGPLARQIASEIATDGQRRLLAVLTKKAGYPGPKEFLASDDAVDILDGTPSSPLVKKHASTLIDALQARIEAADQAREEGWNAYKAEAGIEDQPPAPDVEPDEQVLGEEYEANR